ncbi:hypothetical protein BH23VER1_BH23VER1_10320 [soil metagenome]
MAEAGWRLEEAARAWLATERESLPGGIVFGETPEQLGVIVEDESPVVVFGTPGQVGRAKDGDAGEETEREGDPAPDYRPVFAAERGTGITTEYIALAEEGTTLSDHLGSLMLSEVSDGASRVPVAWIRTALRESLGDGAAIPDSELLRVGRTTRPARAILPVFFGSADLAVVARPDFDAVAELNPQVAESLAAVAVSPPLLGQIVFIRADLSALREVVVIEALSRIGRSPEGHRLLTELGWFGLRPFNDGVEAAYQVTLLAMGLGGTPPPGSSGPSPLAGSGGEPTAAPTPPDAP